MEWNSLKDLKSKKNEKMKWNGVGEMSYTNKG